MRVKQFKAESKRLLELMINSIYSNREIFLRELISNASDAIDKLYYRSLSEGITGLRREDFYIRLDVDKEARTLTITDNGCGMSKEELESNLGTIAKSGTLQFKEGWRKRGYRHHRAVRRRVLLGVYGQRGCRGGQSRVRLRRGVALGVEGR